MKMNKTISLCLLSLSANAFAGSSMICIPADENTYFTDNVELEATDSKSITVNGIELDLDETYRPRNPTPYKRYDGETAEASEWADSGDVQIFFDGKSRLKFTVRGEMFASDTFTCEEK